MTQTRTSLIWVLSIFLFTSIALLPDLASALPAPLQTIQVKPGRLTSPIRTGVATGGQALDEFSLLGVKTQKTERGGEQVILSYGDRAGKVLKGEPGYFHIALDKDSKRIVIDLAQVSRTAIEPTQLAQVLSSSSLVSGSDMTMDPQDGSTNITLSLKSKVAMSVATEAGEQGQVVINLDPVPVQADR